MHETLENCVKVFLGKDGHSSPANICYRDFVYLNSLYEKFGKDNVNAEIKKYGD